MSTLALDFIHGTEDEAVEAMQAYGLAVYQSIHAPTGDYVSVAVDPGIQQVYYLQNVVGEGAAVHLLTATGYVERGYRWVAMRRA